MEWAPRRRQTLSRTYSAQGSATNQPTCPATDRDATAGPQLATTGYAAGRPCPPKQGRSIGERYLVMQSHQRRGTKWAAPCSGAQRRSMLNRHQAAGLAGDLGKQASTSSDMNVSVPTVDNTDAAGPGAAPKRNCRTGKWEMRSSASPVKSVHHQRATPLPKDACVSLPHEGLCR